MTQKERLVELLKNTIKPICFPNWQTWFDAAEGLADYLLDNGVIVPPCKVGDTVFSIGWGDDNIHEDRVNWCSYDSTDASFWFQTTSTDQFTPEDMGRTVFFTREEAEQALKECEQ